MTEHEKLARALLLFHDGGTWGQAKKDLWRYLTGSDDATPRALCDLARKVIADAESKQRAAYDLKHRREPCTPKPEDDL